MVDTVHALPMKGDSFLLFRGRYTILVDGGWKTDQLENKISSHFPDLQNIDIVVVTHADGDHAGGLRDLLGKKKQKGYEASSENRRINEFWLPGRWSDIADELIEYPKSFLKNLLREVNKHGAEGNSSANLEELQEWLATQLNPNPPESPFDSTQDSSEEGGINQVHERIDESIEPQDVEIHDTQIAKKQKEWIEKHFLQIKELEKRGGYFTYKKGHLTKKYREHNIKQGDFEISHYLVETAENIRKILLGAIREKAKIRWFDFDAFCVQGKANGKNPSVLRPINSVEQESIPKGLYSYLYCLSVWNTQSLVFFADPSPNHLGVLFCGDSPLGIGANYQTSFFLHTAGPSLPIVVTAPHHGSESNKRAYEHIGNWASFPFYLRAGGSCHHPGASFRRIPVEQRTCTHCPRRKEKPRMATATMSNEHFVVLSDNNHLKTFVVRQVRRLQNEECCLELSPPIVVCGKECTC